MNDQDALLDRPPEAAVRMLALDLLHDVSAAARHLRSDILAEALHDSRVALRRLRAQLPDWLRPHVVREVTGEEPYLEENLAR